jgi:23S rRNA pseudouridine2605 synthase
MRLQKFISNNSNFSRRKAYDLIKAGKVKVNGQITIVPYYDVKENDIVSIDEIILKKENKKYYYSFNKPKGVVSTLRRGKDPFLNGKKIVYDFFTEKMKKIHNLRLAGRLDFLSEGLMIISNDGEFINILSHPSFKVEKEYILISFKEINKKIIENFEKGIIIDGIFYKAKKIELVDIFSIKIILIEGKNREIRNVASYFNQPIKRLIRTRIANIKLEDLKAGSFKEIDEKEIIFLKELLKNN